MKSMKLLIFVLAISTAAMPAHSFSQEGVFGVASIVQNSPLGEIGFEVDIPLKITANGMETFRLSPGGCLKGPLVFFGKGGEEIFRLGAGDMLGDCPINGEPR